MNSFQCRDYIFISSQARYNCTTDAQFSYHKLNKLIISYYNDFFILSR